MSLSVLATATLIIEIAFGLCHVWVSVGVAQLLHFHIMTICVYLTTKYQNLACCLAYSRHSMEICRWDKQNNEEIKPNFTILKKTSHWCKNYQNNVIL